MHQGSQYQQFHRVLVPIPPDPRVEPNECCENGNASILEEYSPSDHSVCLGDDHINSCQRRGVAKELWHRSWLAFNESSSSEESKQSKSILLCQFIGHLRILQCKQNSRGYLHRIHHVTLPYMTRKPWGSDAMGTRQLARPRDRSKPRRRGYLQLWGLGGGSVIPSLLG